MPEGSQAGLDARKGILDFFKLKQKQSSRNRFSLSVWQTLALGFLIVISIGTLLLALPISNRKGTWTHFVNALFTATSATCVTGLIAFDTYTYWSSFGQVVILALIQVGGIGFMSLITIFAVMLKKKLGVFERKLIMTSGGGDTLSSGVPLVFRIVLGTAIFEGIGTILLATRFCRDFGFGKGLWYASFHSISAFCNAGFDLMGTLEPFSSLTHYVGDPVVSLTIGGLIFVGGIGFLVWSDIWNCRFKFRKFTLHSKVALSASLFLIVISTLLFFLFEKDNPLTMKNLTPGAKFLASLFQATTPRTAGFNTISISGLTEASSLYTIVLMAIGGSSGSTAGGVKVTTFVVMVIGFFAMARNTDDLIIGKKRLETITLRHALGIFVSYMGIICLTTTVLLLAEGRNSLGLKDALFETFSALSTVGLTTGITTKLSYVSKLMLALTMFTGRVGIMTIALALGEKKRQAPIRYGIDKIMIG